MATQYSDMFTYNTLAFDGANVCYSGVTLLKDMCAKKSGTKLDEIRLDTRTGKFTVPRLTRAKTAMETAAKTLVEFKGVHTRFEDKGTVFEKGESSRSGTVTLKLYENKRKLFKPDSTIKAYVLKGILKATNGILVDESIGTRGELLVTIRTSDEIVPKVLTEFTVCTARNRSRVCYYSRTI